MHKINSVTPYAPYMLTVQFAEGVTKTYDVSNLFERIPAFSAFIDCPELFVLAHVDVGGYGVVWNDDIDLSCDELFDNGITITTEFDGLMAASDETSLWNLNDSTLRKAIAAGRFRSGVDVCKFGKQWVVSTEAMEREFGRR